MNQRIDHFNEELRLKLTNAENNLHDLKAKIEGKAADAEQNVRSHLEKVQNRIDLGKAKVTASQAQDVTDEVGHLGGAVPPPTRRYPRNARHHPMPIEDRTVSLLWAPG